RPNPAAGPASRGPWACSSLALPAPEPFIAAHQLVIIPISRHLARDEGRIADQEAPGEVGQRIGGMADRLLDAFQSAARPIAIGNFSGTVGAPVGTQAPIFERRDRCCRDTLEPAVFGNEPE